MTKEQIIIDGIQFNKFGDFYVDYDLNGKFQSISSSAKEYKILKSLIKQLTRKTQECEELKEKIKQVKDVNDKVLYGKDELYKNWREQLDKTNQLKKENEELKSQVTKIIIITQQN